MSESLPTGAKRTWESHAGDEKGSLPLSFRFLEALPFAIDLSFRFDNS